MSIDDLNFIIYFKKNFKILYLCIKFDLNFKKNILYMYDGIFKIDFKLKKKIKNI